MDNFGYKYEDENRTNFSTRVRTVIIEEEKRWRNERWEELNHARDIGEW